MRKFLVLAMLTTASFLIACAPAANNSSNAVKPANVANAANTSNTNAGANTAAIESDIKKAVADMAASLQKGDAAAFEKLYTPNYMFVGPDGRVATGPERIASMKSGETKYESITYDEITVRSNAEGTGAVSISRATVKGRNMGKPVDGQYRVTHVWSKTADGWRLASGQTTAITGATNASSSNTAKPPSPSSPAANSANANK